MANKSVNQKKQSTPRGKTRSKKKKNDASNAAVWIVVFIAVVFVGSLIFAGRETIYFKPTGNKATPPPAKTTKVDSENQVKEQDKEESAAASVNPSDNEQPEATEVAEVLEQPDDSSEKDEGPLMDDQETDAEKDTDSDTDIDLDTDIDKTDIEENNISDIDMPDDIVSPYSGSAGSAKTDGLSNKSLNWYIMRNKDHQPVRGASEVDIRAYNGCYLGDIYNKEVYLTFDEGYEAGYTSAILDVLAAKDVKAAFFVTATYVRDNKDLIKRMTDEGHIVGNHSYSHPNLPELSDQKIVEEMDKTADLYKEVTGKKMPLYVRPPGGVYSEHVLSVLKDMGYKTVFWSFAYQDWLVDNQPGKATAYKMVMDNLHNGAILLLHAVSESNTLALPEIIDAIREQGFEFKTLNQLP